MKLGIFINILQCYIFEIYNGNWWKWQETIDLIRGSSALPKLFIKKPSII